MVKQYKSDALATVHETVVGLAEAGVIAKQTLRAFDEMCLTPVRELSPEDIRKSGCEKEQAKPSSPGT